MVWPPKNIQCVHETTRKITEIGQTSLLPTKHPTNAMSKYAEAITYASVQNKEDVNIATNGLRKTTVNGTTTELAKISQHALRRAELCLKVNGEHFQH
nr:hypothetical protein HmN_000790600 [Hymenolepis microstoma]